MNALSSTATARRSASGGTGERRLPGALGTLMRTTDDVGSLIARVTLGVVIFPHGAQKVLGWFGGPGFSGEMQFFTETMGIPWIFALLAIIAEFFGALGLITGLLGRVAAFGIACVMTVAVFMGHLQNGFFMNWFGNQQGEGFEYHLLAIGLAAVVILKGSGAWSIDHAVTAWERA